MVRVTRGSCEKQIKNCIFHCHWVSALIHPHTHTQAWKCFWGRPQECWVDKNRFPPWHLSVIILPSFPLSETYCWNTGRLLGFVKRGEERSENGDKLYAPILCSSAMEWSKPTYSLCRYLVGFKLSKKSALWNDKGFSLGRTLGKGWVLCN